MRDLTEMSLQEVNTIDIDRALIPYRFTTDYKGKIFEMEIRYNAEYDFFTVDLSIVEDEERTILMLGEKMMLGQMLFAGIYYKNIQTPPLLPWDFSGTSKRMGWEELDNIYLVVMDNETLE